MEFRVLGPLEVEVHGGLLPLGGVKQRILLAALLLEANRVVSAERLLGALWPEGPPPGGSKALQMHVSQLRKTLEQAVPGGSGRELIATRPPGYLIALERDELDLSVFERLVNEARSGAAIDTAAAWRRALGQWRGPPLADLYAEPFARAEIARLESMRLDALEELFESELACGRHHDLVAELEGLAAEHPLRERLRGQLMLVLYRSGRQAQALEVYQDTRRHLVEELGIEPGRPLQDLERAVLQHDPALDLSAATPVAPASVEAQSQPVEPGRQRPERKLATVLFADLVGSTELGEQHDPERTRALLERFYDAMAAEIAASGGTTEKFVGDAIMAAFGAPVALEDHATRALHAAVAMRARLEEQFGAKLALRVGVCTGEVVVGPAREGSSFVTGDSVNVAARLEQLAEPGEILVGERTAAAVRGIFELSELMAVDVRGKRGRVRCARLLGPLAAQQPRGAPMLRRTFVGRAAELELLRATYLRAVQEEGAHLVTILGEAGVGKTSLVGALAEAVSRESPPPRWRSGRCAAYGRGLTFRPLGEILKEYLGILDSDPPTAVRQSLGGRDILGLTLDIDVAQDLAPIVARERLHDAWVELFEEMAASEPVVILVEDLHWANEELLDLLERILAEVRASLLLVATARPELLDRRPGWGGGRRNAITLALEPLSREESARLLGGLVDAPVPARLRRLLLERAEGNPFFLEELLATLIDRGDLERRGDEWSVREPTADLAAPDSVQAVLAARIDLLPPGAKAALQAAAVIGRTFWAGPVRELLGGEEVDFRGLE
ncbi:MAG: AAA family ATPase, partial [Actinobacteria bacterium]|nr:AAA family ATPase [Actinomycetota bacterium]